mmetsp:Transcript_28002/g.50068  ORF Transcript_28002/g.50068 Transcript_28002/m.50068 type:complete len:212 (-) Transcript_28002:69-704(-)
MALVASAVSMLRPLTGLRQGTTHRLPLCRGPLTPLSSSVAAVDKWARRSCFRGSPVAISRRPSVASLDRESAESTTLSGAPPPWTLPASSAALWLLIPFAAQAEDVVEGGSGDLLVSIAFTISVLALGVVTLGVAYLSFMQWNDGRQEKKDQEELGRAKISSPANAAGAKKGKTSKKESDRVRKRDKVGGGAKTKGFSKRVRSEYSSDEDE